MVTEKELLKLALKAVLFWREKRYSQYPHMMGYTELSRAGKEMYTNLTAAAALLERLIQEAS